METMKDPANSVAIMGSRPASRTPFVCIPALVVRLFAIGGLSERGGWSPARAEEEVKDHSDDRARHGDAGGEHEGVFRAGWISFALNRSEEHTSELQSP